MSIHNTGTGESMGYLDEAPSPPMLTMEEAEIIALRWSAMQEEGTMHIRALRNLIRQQVGMERIPDNEPVTVTVTP